MDKKQEEAKLKSQTTFGQEAQSVVDNRAYQFAMTAMRGEIFAKLENSDLSGDNDIILEQVRSLQSIAKMQTQLEKIIKDGSFALAHLEQDAKNHIRNKR
tara:strand:+ start:171 stop:470 length:300 start_codon:yes stop_codon:yes gene_type:complete